jgi:phytoene/squalene synthetase
VTDVEVPTRRAPGSRAPTPRTSRPRPACCRRGFRRHLAAFYAFARAGDDWADEPGHGDAGERRGNAAWRARLLAPRTGTRCSSRSPEAARELGLDTALFERLLDAFERDLDSRRTTRGTTC